MLSTNYEAINPLGCELGHAKRNPSTHRIAPKMRFFDCQRVEHHGDIGDPIVEGVRLRVVRFITTAVTARIDQHQPVIALQGIDITALVPVLDRLQEPVLQDQRWAFAFNSVVYPYSLIMSIRHPPCSLSEG